MQRVAEPGLSRPVRVLSRSHEEPAVITQDSGVLLSNFWPQQKQQVASLLRVKPRGQGQGQEEGPGP